jgi:hypothetical protein
MELFAVAGQAGGRPAHAQLLQSEAGRQVGAGGQRKAVVPPLPHNSSFLPLCRPCHSPPAGRPLPSRTLYRRYITAVYWAYTTMTTVGYGDIVGTTVAEKVRSG